VTSELESGPLVLTVILNYRTAEMTLESAKAALREMEGIAGEIVIVDNDSGDGSFEAMTEGVRAAGWTRVRVLQSGRNGGYGAGNNFGVRAGLSDGRRPDYVYILNSDAFPTRARSGSSSRRWSATRSSASRELHPRTRREPHLTAFRHPSIWSEFEAPRAPGR
jgi:glycosyltransferase involved in cell wall biosynthesis